MQFPSESYLEQLRKKYPVGTKLQLISMRNEKYPILSGTVGVVTHIDDAGSIHMRWENGSSLALIPEIDSFQIVSEAKKWLFCKCWGRRKQRSFGKNQMRTAF